MEENMVKLLAGKAGRIRNRQQSGRGMPIMSGNNQGVKKENPLGYAPIMGLIRKFAIPSIISMLVNAAYNITDQIFIGHVVGMLEMQRPM